MKPEPEVRAYLSKLETINTNLREKIIVLESCNVILNKRVIERIDRNCAKIRALQCVLNG